VVTLVAFCLPALAQAQGKRRRRRHHKRKRPAKVRVIKKPAKQKVFDFSGIDLKGRLRTPQLLYFLDRASEELQRASLQRRSFIPEMVRTLDEEAL